MGLLEIPSALTQIMTGPSLRGVTAASRGLRVVSSALAPPEIVYVQPHGDGPGVLGFHLFADVVDRHGDPVSHRFAASLREWADVKA